MSITYRGETFSGYNKPKVDNKTKHKKVVLAKVGDQVKMIRYGLDGYKHNYSKKARDSYLARSAGIRDGSGNKTASNKLSANYWARRDLWKA